MNRALALLLSFPLLVGCASSPETATTPQIPVTPTPAPPTPSPSEEAAPEPPEQSAAQTEAERSSREEEDSVPALEATAADPLAVGEAMESAMIPQIEITPARELRSKTVRDLEAGQKLALQAETVEAALQQLNARLGKPSWVEDGKKHVWVVRDKVQCYRLALDADGTVETDTAPLNEWRMLSAVSQQNVCTGAVEKGIPGMQN